MPAFAIRELRLALDIGRPASLPGQDFAAFLGPHARSAGYTSAWSAGTGSPILVRRVVTIAPCRE
jgi:hypothetical protein